MSKLSDAEAHLTKAEEFLLAAEATQDLELYNAATSNAVISGINAKDAICLMLTGSTAKSDDHNQAVVELKKSGPAGAALAPTLLRLLKLKTKSQYQKPSIACSDAENAVRWARKLFGGAQQVVHP